MRLRWLFLILINAAFLLHVSGQAVITPKKEKEARQKEQFQIDEQLASQYYRDQDYEKARDIYKQLFEKSGQTGHFQMYIDCLIFLKEFDKAEKELKAYAKKHPNYYRADTDAIYIYTLQGKTDKAKKKFNEVLSNLPENPNTIRSISYALQARNLNEMALAVLEKGNDLMAGRETFYMEQANLNLSAANYQEAFRLYFKELETHPGQYDNIRNRLQTMLFYDVNHSISDDLRIALLKQTQEKPDNLEFAQLLVWFALQQEDYDIALAQCQSIDRKTHDQDAQINNLAGICLNNKQYDIAKEGYNYIIGKGKSNPFYGQAITGAIKADYQKLKAENHSDTKAYERLSKRIDEAYSDISTYDLAKLTLIQADIMAYHLGQTDQAIALLTNTIATVNSKQGQAELKLALGDIYLHKDEVWEATLLYSQKAATSKLIANDAMTLSLVIKDNLEADTLGVELNRLARADYRIYQQREDEALALLDDIIATGNEISKPHALFRKGEIEEKRKDFANAEQLFLQIVEQYPESYMADAALMHAALIEQNELKDKALAGEHYEKLIDEYPTSIYTAQAKKNYRKL